MKAWGFTYKQFGVRDKVGALGMGSMLRICHEPFLIGVRGAGLPVKAHDIPSVIRACRGRHSQKPQLVYDVIDRMWPTAQKIEFFARATRAGWTTWGGEVQADVEQTQTVLLASRERIRALESYAKTLTADDLERLVGIARDMVLTRPDETEVAA
jgi:N6-adenosine-specific RNA methylase IME4